MPAETARTTRTSGGDICGNASAPAVPKQFARCCGKESVVDKSAIVAPAVRKKIARCFESGRRCNPEPRALAKCRWPSPPLGVYTKRIGSGCKTRHPLHPVETARRGAFLRSSIMLAREASGRRLISCILIIRQISDGFRIGREFSPCGRLPRSRLAVGLM